MKQEIEVHYQLVKKPGETVAVPIQYKVVDDTEQCIKTVYCAVNLPEDSIPHWLSPAVFSIVNHYHKGMHRIDYNHEEVDNVDAEFFRYKMYADIMVRERLKEGIRMEHC